MEKQDLSFQEMLNLWGNLTKQVAERTSQLILNAFQTAQQDPNVLLNPWAAGKFFSKAAVSLAKHPDPLFQAHQQLSNDLYHLWSATLEQMNTGEKQLPVISPEKNDKRFKHAQWDEHPYFNFLKQSYLLTSKYFFSLSQNVQDLDPQTARKLAFYTRQLIDATAPSNFPLTNPQVVEKMLETGGKNFIKGLENFLADLERGNGTLAIAMTNPKDFELGVNLAITPGKVIFQNALVQLIQYTPTTQEVARTPLLIVPPWINKYYVLDLSPKNSFVKWLVAQGHTVFMISWINPNEKLADKTFEDYMLEGLFTSLQVVQKITGEDQVHLLGYCLGGNLVACFLAYLSALKKNTLASATYLATLIDFSQAGDLSIFIDEEQLQALETRMAEKGYLDGQAMATTFSLLRANDLIWSFVINNYLLGQDPLPLDFLYWNGDSTHMPAAMHSYYLRNMFQKNLLCQPGGLTLGGQAIDLKKIETPSFILATKEDHIAPWGSCYAGVPLYRGPVEFVLASSGHVAGVINPPAAEKYSYFTGPTKKKNPAQWLKTAQETKGSWWTYWHKWLLTLQPERVKARAINHPDFPPLEDAPGSYVKTRSASA